MFVYISATDIFIPKTKAISKLDKVIDRIKKQGEAQGKKGKDRTEVHYDVQEHS